MKKHIYSLERVNELRALMAEHNLTQAEVAQFSGFHKRTVEGWLANPEAASSINFSARNMGIIKALLPAYLKTRAESMESAHG